MTSFYLDIELALTQKLHKRLEKVLPKEGADIAGTGTASQRARRVKLDPGCFDLVSFSERAERVAARGGTDFDIAVSLKVDETRLMLWFNSFPALEAAVEKGRGRWLQRLRRLQRPPCPRCGGLLDETIELFGEAFSIIKRVPRCLICGKRFYHTMTPVPPLVSAKGKR